MLKLKLQYFGHLMRMEKTLMLGKTEGKRRRGCREWDGWMASPTQWTWVWANSVRQCRTGRPGVLLSMGSQRVRQDWVAERQQMSYLEISSLFSNIWGFSIHTFVLHFKCNFTGLENTVPMISVLLNLLRHVLWPNIWSTLYADDTTLIAEGEEELKSLLMKVKEESE